MPSVNRTWSINNFGEIVSSLSTADHTCRQSVDKSWEGPLLLLLCVFRCLFIVKMTIFDICLPIVLWSTSKVRPRHKSIIFVGQISKKVESQFTIDWLLNLYANYGIIDRSSCEYFFHMVVENFDFFILWRSFKDIKIIFNYSKYFVLLEVALPLLLHHCLRNGECNGLIKVSLTIT